MSGRFRRVTTWIMSFVLAVGCLFPMHVQAVEEDKIISAAVQGTDNSQKGNAELTEYELVDFESGRLLIESDLPVMDAKASEVTNIFENYYVIQYETTEEALEAYEGFLENPAVSSVAPDRKIQLEEEVVAAEEYRSWGTQKIGIDALHGFICEKYTQLPEIQIAVLDTGIDTDLDIFQGRILSGGKNYCTSRPSSKPEDDHGHGTMVSSIIEDNTLTNVKILPIKVMNKSGEGYDSHIIQGIGYAIEYGVDIINLSIGGDGEKPMYESIIKRADERGIAVLVAAGNESEDVSACTPANIESSISISSINEDETFSSFSNYGNTIDFSAPGDDILTLGMDGTKYRVSGTSFATPFATAAFANIKSIDYEKTGMEIYEIIKAYVVDLGPEGWDKQFGYGCISLLGIENYYDIKKYSRGDANQDGVINVLDAYLILQYIVGKDTLTEAQKYLADIDEDSTVTVLDVLQILQMEVGS